MICSVCPASNFHSVFFFYICAATSSRPLSSCPALSCPGTLQTSKEDLLQADFEGALKFFRVQLPKRYRAAENARRLMEQACNIKVRRSAAARTHSLFASSSLLVLHFYDVENVLREPPSCIQTNLDWCKVKQRRWKFLSWRYTLGNQYLQPACLGRSWCEQHGGCWNEKP